MWDIIPTKSLPGLPTEQISYPREEFWTAPMASKNKNSSIEEQGLADGINRILLRPQYFQEGRVALCAPEKGNPPPEFRKETDVAVATL
ncbi:hypothetical protein [Cyclobacterium sp.]|uniref:hypothetical protein n=1 Tax=Cyclobacterium sp. TaxID=1966343 RepID=UPI0019A21D8A|nr:hypothetical protein [Cyclobacterium sp.]MBD3627652.1 hypothetical protein [Cyclobacterium sp.]